MNNLFKLTGFKSIGFKAIGILLAAAMLTGLSACGGVEDIRKTISMEYLDARTGKPIVYPAGVDAPEISDAFAIPQLPSGNQANSRDINDLVKPPSLLPPEQQPSVSDDDDEDDKTAMARSRSKIDDAE